MIRLKIFFAWYEFCIGFYWDRKNKHLLFYPLPTVVFDFWNENSRLEKND